MPSAMPAGTESSAASARLGDTRGIRSAPTRFIETWIDAVGGFLFCVVMPIPLYATKEPFSTGLGATEQTILATAFAFSVVWYCGRRLDTFPRATLQGNLGYIAPLAAIAYASIAVALLLVRSEYSRVQLFGSGALAVVWMAGVAQLRARYLTRHYAVLPTSLIKSMPELPTCRWLDFDDVQAGDVRVDAIVADLSADLGEAAAFGACERGHRRRARARPAVHSRDR